MLKVLIACGPNGIEVPCMVFAAHDGSAEQFLQKLHGLCHDSELSLSGQPRLRLHAELPAAARDACFQQYYHGAGGVSMFLLREAQFGSKLTRWDLD